MVGVPLLPNKGINPLQTQKAIIYPQFTWKIVYAYFQCSQKSGVTYDFIQETQLAACITRFRIKFIYISYHNLMTELYFNVSLFTIVVSPIERWGYLMSVL